MGSAVGVTPPGHHGVHGHLDGVAPGGGGRLPSRPRSRSRSRGGGPSAPSRPSIRPRPCRRQSTRRWPRCGRTPASSATRRCGPRSSRRSSCSVSSSARPRVQVREHASAELSSKKDVIDARLDQVHQEMRSELGRLGTMVAALSEASAQKFGQVDQSLRTHAEITEHLSESARSLPRGARQPDRTRPVGRADGRGRAAPGRLRRERQLRQADPGRGWHGASGLHVPAAQGPRAVHGRQVPDGRLPPLPRSAHRGRTPSAPHGVPARCPAAGEGAGQARLRPRQRPRHGRLRLVVPPQRAAHRVHPRTRPGICSTMPSASAS